MVLFYAISPRKGMAAKFFSSDPQLSLPPLPELTGRIAVLGGSEAEKSQLLVGLALRQARRQGVVHCLDGRRRKQTEVQFRLLLRGAHCYAPLPPSGEVPADIAQAALSALTRGLSLPPPLLLLDATTETPMWARTLAFLLKAGVVVVELLADAGGLVFGRYDTVLLLRADQDAAEAHSRAVGCRASAKDIHALPAGEGILIHFARAQHVQLPGVE